MSRTAHNKDCVTKRPHLFCTTESDHASQLMIFADHVYAASEPDWEKLRETLGNDPEYWEGEGLPMPKKVEDTMTAEDRKEQLEPDYEPEQAYGTADDFRRHRQYGGTREDY